MTSRLLYRANLVIVAGAAEAGKVGLALSPPADASKTIRVVGVGAKTAGSAWLANVSTALPSGGTEKAAPNPVGIYNSVACLSKLGEARTAIFKVYETDGFPAAPTSARVAVEALSTSVIAGSIDTFEDEFRPADLVLRKATDSFFLSAAANNATFFGWIEWIEEPNAGGAL